MTTIYDTTTAVTTALTNTYLWNQIKAITGVTTFTAANHIAIVTRDELLDILINEPISGEYVNFFVKLPQIRSGEMDRYPCHDHVLDYEVVALLQMSDTAQQNIQKIAEYTINAIEAMALIGYAVRLDDCDWYRKREGGNFICALIRFYIDQRHKITS